MTYFEVVNVANGEVLSDLPSPLLIQAGGGEAFSPDGGRFWRLREPTDPKGTTYTRVRIRHLEDWSVDFHVKVVEADGETFETDDWFPVRAISATDAIARATKALEDDYRDRWGDDATLTLTNARPHTGFRL